MNAFINGFSIATGKGPLCEEPMQGACFIINNVMLVEEEKKEEDENEE